MKGSKKSVSFEEKRREHEQKRFSSSKSILLSSKQDALKQVAHFEERQESRRHELIKGMNLFVVTEPSWEIKQRWVSISSDEENLVIGPAKLASPSESWSLRLTKAFSGYISEKRELASILRVTYGRFPAFVLEANSKLREFHTWLTFFVELAPEMEDCLDPERFGFICQDTKEADFWVEGLGLFGPLSPNNRYHVRARLLWRRLKLRLAERKLFPWPHDPQFFIKTNKKKPEPQTLGDQGRQWDAEQEAWLIKELKEEKRTAKEIVEAVRELRQSRKHSNSGKSGRSLSSSVQEQSKPAEAKDKASAVIDAKASVDAKASDDAGSSVEKKAPTPKESPQKAQKDDGKAKPKPKSYHQRQSTLDVMLIRKATSEVESGDISIEVVESPDHPTAPKLRGLVKTLIRRQASRDLNQLHVGSEDCLIK